MVETAGAPRGGLSCCELVRLTAYACLLGGGGHGRSGEAHRSTRLVDQADRDEILTFADGQVCAEGQGRAAKAGLLGGGDLDSVRLAEGRRQRSLGVADDDVDHESAGELAIAREQSHARRRDDLDGDAVLTLLHRLRFAGAELELPAALAGWGVDVCDRAVAHLIVGGPGGVALARTDGVGAVPGADGNRAVAALVNAGAVAEGVI